MTRRDLVNALRSLTNKQFVDLFYEAVEGRNIYPTDPAVDAHLVLGNAWRFREEESDREWHVELLCPVPNQDWVDDASICQHGEHCGMPTASWAKRSMCPVCGGEAHGT